MINHEKSRYSQKCLKLYQSFTSDMQRHILQSVFTRVIALRRLPLYFKFYENLHILFPYTIPPLCLEIRHESMHPTETTPKLQLTNMYY